MLFHHKLYSRSGISHEPEAKVSVDYRDIDFYPRERHQYIAYRASIVLYSMAVLYSMDNGGLSISCPFISSKTSLTFPSSQFGSIFHYYHKDQQPQPNWQISIFSIQKSVFYLNSTCLPHLYQFPFLLLIFG